MDNRDMSIKETLYALNREGECDVALEPELKIWRVMVISGNPFKVANMEDYVIVAVSEEEAKEEARLLIKHRSIPFDIAWVSEMKNSDNGYGIKIDKRLL